ncbi:hypothetical protein D9611_000753 [Ephemerocybe angulata]|uniref:Uncharacterized protein n=1 Tax=Ephemerocybe angulata TaxID=980116 RepID=A0A8H5F7I0_9AGAR|nr:hypothetical protein D9611_000753 [Tulosesus angulatus]
MGAMKAKEQGKGERPIPRTKPTTATNVPPPRLSLNEHPTRAPSRMQSTHQEYRRLTACPTSNPSALSDLLASPSRTTTSTGPAERKSHDDDDDDDRLDDTLKPKPKRRRRRRTPFNVDSTEGCNCSVVPSVNVIQAPDLCDSRLLKPLRTLDSVSTRFTHRRWRHAHQLVVLAHCGEAGEPRGKRHGWEPTCDVEKLRPSQVVLVDFACRS